MGTKVVSSSEQARIVLTGWDSREGSFGGMDMAANFLFKLSYKFAHKSVGGTLVWRV